MSVGANLNVPNGTNDLINIATSSYGWTAFTTSITATTTNPVISGPTVNSLVSSLYFQMGKVLFIRFTYYGNGNFGGSSGTGNYMFSIPFGFTINTSIVTTFGFTASTAGFFCLGTANVTDGTNNQGGTAGPLIYDSTHYAVWADGGPGHGGGQFWGRGFYSLNGYVTASANLTIPIL